MKVTAFDADSKENGEVQYHKINGDSEFIDAVEIDMNTGNIFLVSNKGFDRETTQSKHVQLIFKILQKSNCDLSAVSAISNKFLGITFVTNTLPQSVTQG